MIRVFIVAFAAFRLIFPAYADELKVDDLKTLCSGADEVSKAACEFYILGVAEGIGIANAATSEHKSLCLSDSIYSPTMTFAVNKSIREDLIMFPDDKNLPANNLVGPALAGHFPCTADKK